ncbi:MAG: alpha/beta hydrolase [Vicinamibacterales bacterium]
MGLLIWLVLAAIGLAVVAGLVRLVEPRLAFFPLPGGNETPAQYGIPYTPLTISTVDGERIHVWHLPRADAQAQVVYFHGNGGNLSLWSDVLVGLWRQRFDVIAFDYRGYGLSTGRPSEDGLYRDVDATTGVVGDRLRRPDLSLLYWGRSLGATMAAYAAAAQAPDGVVLEAGYPSARAVLETNPVMWLLSWLSSYQFPTARWMASVQVPTLVLHGDADSVIPYRLGQRLYEAIPGPKRFVTIAGGDHNDVEPRAGNAYWVAVAEFVRSLPTPPRVGGAEAMRW